MATPRVVTLALLLSAACAPPSIRTQVLVVPEWRERVALRRLSVQPFAGERGDDTAALVEEALRGATLDGVPCFDVVAYAPSLRARAAGPGPVGRELGVDAVLSAEVTVAEASRNWASGAGSRCDEYDKKGSCTNWVSQVCRWSEARFALIVSMHVVETGDEVRIGTFEEEARTDQSCADESTGFVSQLVDTVADAIVDSAFGGERTRETLLRSVQSTVVERVIAAVTPHYEPIAVPLMKPGKRVPKSTRERLEAALGDLKKKGAAPQAACRILEDARTLAPDDPAIVYDLAVCAEHAGRLDEARELYARAVESNVPRREWAVRGLERVEGELADRRLLAGAQGEESAPERAPTPTTYER